jgi:hypothetical protein
MPRPLLAYMHQLWFGESLLYNERKVCWQACFSLIAYTSCRLPVMAVPTSTSYMQGHAELAAYMSLDSDLQIYRRFSRLGARNLLHLQSELSELEEWFDNFDETERRRADSAADDDERVTVLQRNKHWTSFLSSTGEGDAKTEEQKRQAQKLSQIRRLQDLMDKYRWSLRLSPIVGIFSLLTKVLLERMLSSVNRVASHLLVPQNMY